MVVRLALQAPNEGHVFHVCIANDYCSCGVVVRFCAILALSDVACEAKNSDERIHSVTVFVWRVLAL